MFYETFEKALLGWDWNESFESPTQGLAVFIFLVPSFLIAAYKGYKVGRTDLNDN